MQIHKRNDSGIWVICALAEEFDYPDANIAYTGMGKVNGAITAQHIITAERPRLIIQLGAAGSRAFDYGQIVSVNQFVQRDMNTTEFLSPKYVVPGTDDAQILEYGLRDEKYPAAICGSGDTFVRTIETDIWNIVDMEVFGIAYAARAAGIPMKCYKFISDGKSENTSDKEFLDVLNEARAALNKLYEEIVNES